MLLFARTVDSGLNHDEHQFIAPGALLATEGLLPYRDYPLFHLPNLVFAYAAMTRAVGDPILGPKLLSFSATWLSLGFILFASLRATRGGTGRHLLVAASVVLLLVFDPLVTYTAGKTWNHEAPTFLLLTAVLCHVLALRRDRLIWIILSGAAGGLAVGTRLTFLPCLVPFFALIFLFPFSMRRRGLMAAAFTGATLVSLTPSIYFLSTSPEPFLFGNLQFPRLRLLDPENTRIQKTMTIWRKLRFFVKEVLLPSWPLSLAFFAVLIPNIRRQLGAIEPSRSGLLVVAWTALALVAGCFLPSRYQYQHFFALVPLMVLGLALSGSEITTRTARAYLYPAMLAIFAALTLALAVMRPIRGNVAFSGWENLTKPDEWFSSRARKFGAVLRTHVPTGRILTLAPAWPLAAGLQIYPEFATGPFAWRSARFVPTDRRSTLHIVAPDDLANFLRPHPPVAILTGVEEDDLEEPLIKYARENGYSPIKLPRKTTLWKR